MKRLKAVLKRVFCLPPLLTVVIAVPSFAFVFVMLGTGTSRFWRIFPTFCRLTR